jgi:hypothetical protein
MPGPESFGAEEWLTRSGFYRIAFDSELSPIPINRIHDWVFTITTPEGDAVAGAVLSVTGGMPLHNHGLPTQPRMTKELGEGRYLVEGMRFHMNGDWELLVTVDVDGRRDTIVIPLTI